MQHLRGGGECADSALHDNGAPRVSGGMGKFVDRLHLPKHIGKLINTYFKIYCGLGLGDLLLPTPPPCLLSPLSPQKYLLAFPIPLIWGCSLEFSIESLFSPFLGVITLKKALAVLLQCSLLIKELYHIVRADCLLIV